MDKLLFKELVRNNILSGKNKDILKMHLIDGATAQTTALAYGVDKADVSRTAVKFYGQLEKMRNLKPASYSVPSSNDAQDCDQSAVA